MIERAIRCIMRYGISGLLALCALSATASAVAQAGTSDLELTATLLPPAPWVENQRVTLTVTARNLLTTPADATFFEFQPRIPGPIVNNPLIGSGLPTSTCQRSGLCTEFGNNCWIVGLLQGLESRTCRVDFQVPPGVPAITGQMRVQLFADPPDVQTSNNELFFVARTVVVAAVPTLSRWPLVAMWGLLMISLWCFRSRLPS